MTFYSDGYVDAVLGSRGLATQHVLVDDLSTYAAGGVAARVVDLPADTAISQGVEIKGDDDGRISAEFDRLKVLPALADAYRWARLTGGGAIVLLADDGRLLRDPLNVSALGTIRELRVFDLNSISATEHRYNDPTKDNFGMPEIYQVKTDSQTGAWNFFVHESRLIEVPGDPIPRAVTVNPIPWAGRPAVSKAFDAIRLYRQGLRWADKLLERKQQAVYSMKGLADAIAAQLEADVQKRIGLVDAVRGILNTVAVDSEDSYTVLDLDVGGVKDLLGEYQVAVSTESGIPVTLLFGRSPAGMNATGDADFRGFNGMVRGDQTRKLSPALERITSLVLAQKTFANPPSNWRIKWPSLYVPTEKEAADVRKTNAEADKIETEALDAAMGTGAVSAEQALEYLREQGKYGLKAESSREAAAAYAQTT